MFVSFKKLESFYLCRLRSFRVLTTIKLNLVCSDGFNRVRTEWPLQAPPIQKIALFLHKSTSMSMACQKEKFFGSDLITARPGDQV